MDRTRHLAKDANVRQPGAGILGIDNAIAVTIIVALKDLDIANGPPLICHAVIAQDNLSIDISLLLEIDTARIAALIHIVGQI